MQQTTLGQAIWIGACQILSAVFPGTSRSMATIAAGQTAGMSRAAALEFSFLLSIPTMAAATAYDLLKSLRHPAEASTGIGAAPAGLVAVGHAVLLGYVVARPVGLPRREAGRAQIPRPRRVGRPPIQQVSRYHKSQLSTMKVCFSLLQVSGDRLGRREESKVK